MVRLSINIPTYNRCSFLSKDLGIIIEQLRDAHLEDAVEINISDNASFDDTYNVVYNIIEDNKDITITYFKQEKNLGPDLNFINAMKMARYEYSILFGDDDFFEPGAIKKIFTLIENNQEVSFFLSNRVSVDQDDNIITKVPFLREDVCEEVFDFSKKNDGRAYFSLVCDHGGILTFISSVVYRTGIIEEMGPYDKRCIGTCYSFLYYWWSALSSGKKIMYVADYLVRATTLGVTNNNYGRGLKRLLVDTEGLSTIADVVFKEDHIAYKKDFLAAVRRPITFRRIASGFFPSDKEGRNRLLQSMSTCDYSSLDISFMNYLFTLRNGVKICLKSILPNILTSFLRI